MNIDFYKGVESVQKAEIERLKMDVLAKHSLVVAFGVVIQDQTAEIERLKRVIEQAIGLADLHIPYSDSVMVHSQSRCEPIRFVPELAAWLKEKENAN